MRGQESAVAGPPENRLSDDDIQKDALEENEGKKDEDHEGDREAQHNNVRVLICRVCSSIARLTSASGLPSLRALARYAIDCF